MKNPLSVALLLGAAGLAVWTVIELASPAGVANAVAPDGRRALPMAPAGATQDRGQARDQEVATILARPLFNPSRRPKGTAAAPQAEAAVSTLPRMTAILIDGSARSAIFEGHGKPTVLSEGGHLGPFTIQRIEPQQVIILGPDGKRVVHTSFSAEPPASPLPPALPRLLAISPIGSPNIGPPGLPNMGPPR